MAMNENFPICSKNTLSNYRHENKDARYCDGPFGNGIDIKCVGTCKNACMTKEILIEQIGEIVCNRQGII
jgi:hypothetical protein